MKAENKVIVVTGGGNGMGRELVLGLLKKGAKVAAVDINEASLQETIALAGDKKDSLATFAVDITNKQAVEELPGKVISRFGLVDGVINNAGIIQPFVKLNDIGFETIQRVLNVNLFGTLYMTKAFLPHLLTRPQAHIVNMSSMGGFLPVPGQTIYCAAKAAVKLLTEGLNAELTATNVRVSVVFPGAVNTNIMANSGLAVHAPAGNNARAPKILSAAAAANMIIAGMEQNKPRVFTGSDSKMMDFLYRLNPGFASRLIYKQMSARLG